MLQFKLTKIRDLPNSVLNKTLHAAAKGLKSVMNRKLTPVLKLMAKRQGFNHNFINQATISWSGQATCRRTVNKMILCFKGQNWFPVDLTKARIKCDLKSTAFFIVRADPSPHMRRCRSWSSSKSLSSLFFISTWYNVDLLHREEICGT